MKCKICDTEMIFTPLGRIEYYNLSQRWTEYQWHCDNCGFKSETLRKIISDNSNEPVKDEQVSIKDGDKQILWMIAIIVLIFLVQLLTT